ncbi:hypothetical protein V5799_015059, partial [Amblyomma americanum]
FRLLEFQGLFAELWSAFPAEMDDIDEYARRLAERTRARSKNFHHKTAEPPPAKRSLTADDLNCGSGRIFHRRLLRALSDVLLDK